MKSRIKNFKYSLFPDIQDLFMAGNKEYEYYPRAEIIPLSPEHNSV